MSRAMLDWLQRIPEWLEHNQTLFWCLGSVSILTLVGSIILVPVLILRIPADYFDRRRRQPKLWADRHPAIRMILVISKNILGAILVLGGLIMLGLPGPGLAVLLIGILMLDFPGKFRLERWIFSRGLVLGPINKLRQRKGREPLTLPAKKRRKSKVNKDTEKKPQMKTDEHR